MTGVHLPFFCDKLLSYFFNNLFLIQGLPSLALGAALTNLTVLFCLSCQWRLNKSLYFTHARKTARRNYCSPTAILLTWIQNLEYFSQWCVKIIPISHRRTELEGREWKEVFLIRLMINALFTIYRCFEWGKIPSILFLLFLWNEKRMLLIIGPAFKINLLKFCHV